MNDRGEMLRGIYLAGDERSIDHVTRLDIGELVTPPDVHLLVHRLEVPLHAIDAD